MKIQYENYLKSEDWQDKRRQKLSKKNRCGICGSQKSLDVHHLNYKNLYDVTQNDLRVLCRKCHFTAHDLHKKGVFKFTSTSPHSRFAILKHAVKKELNIGNFPKKY